MIFPSRLSLLLATAVVLWASTAQAVTVGPMTRINQNAHLEPNVLSRADCMGGNNYRFDLTGITPGNTIAVWGSVEASCTSEQRTNGTCVQINEPEVFNEQGVQDYEVSAEAIVAGLLGEETCDDPSTSSTRRKFNLFFFENLEGDAATQPQIVSLEIDLLGPRPPSDVSTGVGSETSVVINYGMSPDETEVKSYRVYCNPPVAASGAGGSDATATTATTGVGGAQADFHPHAAGFGGTGGVSGMGGAGVGGVAMGGAATGGVASGGAATGASTTTGVGTTTGAATGAGGGAGCPAGDLVPGELPPDTVTPCGEGNALTLTVSGLDPDQSYAFAVSAIDNVGNDGPLSEVVCGQGEPTVDFFEAYRAAGGQGGGGICNCSVIGADSRTRGALYLTLAGALVLLVRRRDPHGLRRASAQRNQA